MTASNRDVLAATSFGQRVAEDEIDDLASYFVETEQWRKVEAGEIDVVFGTKGSGKSAIYATLTQREDELFDSGIVLLAAEKPRGTPAFQDLVADPPTTEIEFVSLWKLYMLSLLGSLFVEYGIRDTSARHVRDALSDAGLLPESSVTLRARVRSVLDFVRRYLRPQSVEGEVKLDPATGSPVGLATKITLSEPSVEDARRGARSVDSLLASANSALENSGYRVWLLFDRLDVAFAESRELEANGLRALFKVYLDVLDLNAVQMKIFLRSDVWKAITAGGFREASHITRQMTLTWSNASMLHLVVNRLLRNSAVVDHIDIVPDAVRSDAQLQREFFDALVPEQVDVGKNPQTFEWILGRVQDGAKVFAPREVIHLLTEARDVQLAMLERGEQEPSESQLISRQALRESLIPVSRVRLEQTVYAEYPEARDWLLSLEREKTEHSLQTLATIWDTSEDEARARTDRLVEIGFFEQRGTKADPRYWIPFLYRPGLNLVQGSAVTGTDSDSSDDGQQGPLDDVLTTHAAAPPAMVEHATRRGPT